MTRRLFASALLVLLASSSAQAQTILDIITRDQESRFDTLVTLLATARLTGALDDPNQPMTLYAPTEDAFGVSRVNVTKLRQPTWSAHLNDLLTYHVSDGYVFSFEMRRNQEYETLQGEETITVTSRNPLVLNDNATVLEKDKEATNGIVHVIDHLLLPTSNRETIYEYAKNDPEYSILADLIERAGLVEALSGQGPRTLFAPPNSAFASLQGFGWPAFIDDEARVRNFLLYHLVDGNVFEEQLKTRESSSIRTVQGSDIDVTIVQAYYRQNDDSDEQILLNIDTTVTSTDKLVKNGLFHTIDTVLTPPEIEDPTVAALIQSQGLTTFEDAAKRTGLWDTLNNPSEQVTVFASVNKGFSPEFDTILNDDAYYLHLQAAMNYQVVPNQALWTGELPPGLELRTLYQGQRLTVTQGHPSRPIILDFETTVQVGDLVGSNGALHVVDQVMPPPFLGTNVVDVISRQPAQHSYLIYFLVLTGLIPDLTEQGTTFTILAPTNQAFFDLMFNSGSLLGSGWTSDLDKMREILSYHVIPDVLYRPDMDHNSTHETLLGPTIQVTDTSYSAGPYLGERRMDAAEEIPTVPASQIVVNGIATILNSDQLANNGVVHTIDTVLIPPKQDDFFGYPGPTEAVDEELCFQYGGFDRLCCSMNSDGSGASASSYSKQTQDESELYCQYLVNEESVAVGRGGLRN